MLLGGAGADLMDGGDGIDTADYAASAAGVSVNLLAGSGTGGTAEGDELVGIENLRGTASADQMTGNTEANQLFGLGSNDALQGGSGDDWLAGGAGKDTLWGNAGADTFVFGTLTESARGKAARDVIKDFQRRTDHIDLSGIDASTKKAGDNAFKFIGTKPFHKKAGELHIIRHDKPGTAHDWALVAGDVNGDGKADFHIEVAGLKMLKAVDFIL